MLKLSSFIIIVFVRKREMNRNCNIAWTQTLKSDKDVYPNNQIGKEITRLQGQYHGNIKCSR